jgi:hypothetical protein
MLALSNAVVGSVVIRTDVNKNYVLSAANPAVLANWIELLTPAPPVQTVNGYTGSITLAKSDVGLGNAENTSDANKPVSSATQTALNLKANAADVTTLLATKANTASLATVATSGNFNDLTNKPTTTAASTLSGTVAVANGGTGLTSAGLNGQVLSSTGSGTLTWTTLAPLSVGTISSTSSSAGASITNSVLSLTPADATNGGIVTTGNQAFSGGKVILFLIVYEN